VPGGGSLHNCMSAHGPDRATFERASSVKLEPHKLENTLAFMFESRYVIQPTRFALECPELQTDYHDCWQDIEKNFSAG
jgi:homogentisate 1,2-dioxygenase